MLQVYYFYIILLFFFILRLYCIESTFNLETWENLRVNLGVVLNYTKVPLTNEKFIYASSFYSFHSFYNCIIYLF